MLTIDHKKEIFLQQICEEVDKLTTTLCPEGLNKEDIQVHIRFVIGDSPLGKNIRVLGNSVMIRLESIKYDDPVVGSPRSVAGAHRRGGDKFLGYDIVWVNMGHISSVYPGKDLWIEENKTQTFYIVLMEESTFRLRGTCEGFFDSITEPLSEYFSQSSSLTGEVL